MAVPNSDEDKYANESFEADSDVLSEYGSPEVRSDSDEVENRSKQSGPKNMALLASTRDRQMMLHGMIGGYSGNKDALPFDSSSDDEDVVISETVAEINTGSMVYDNISTNSRRNSATINVSKMDQILETTEDDSDFQPNLINQSTVFHPPEEAAFVSDVSEELEMEMEMQVYKNQAHLVRPNSYNNKDYTESNITLQSEGKSVADQTGCNLMQDLADKIQQELQNKKPRVMPNIDCVAKMVAKAISQLKIDRNCSDEYDQNVYNQEEESATDYSNNCHEQNLESEIDLTQLRGSKSYTVFRPPAQYKNPFHRISSMQSASISKMQRNYEKNTNADIEQNLDSPKDYKICATKLKGLSSRVETETCQETESDGQYYNRKMELRNNKSGTHSFRSSGSEQPMKPSRSSTAWKANNQPKSGTTNRKSWTFTNDRMRQIEHDNRILLQKILTQKPTVPKPKQPTKYQYLPPTTFISNATIERKKKQRQIDLDNQILKRKLESVSFRRKPLCYE